MFPRMVRRACLLAVTLVLPAAAQPAFKSIHPTVAEVVRGVSEANIARIMQKLESFETRDTHSAVDHLTRGIGAARRWIAEELKSYSPRLEVRLDAHPVKKGGRIRRDLEVVNVVATLPGASQFDRHVLLTAHYDSLHLIARPGTAPDDADRWDWQASAAADYAPGVSDNGSGTAAVMELARVMSRFTWKKTLVFVLFAAEEQGLVGSRLYVRAAQEAKQTIDGVFNNDIIGTEVAGNGASANSVVRVFSSDPNDSPSRSLARFIKETAERYVPGMRVDLIFRADRFARGGDHTPFAMAGYPAVRLSTPSEHYANQHTATDTFANSSPAYTARVAQVNAAAAASLAMAPRPPAITRKIDTGGREVERANLERGESRYDAVAKWQQPEPEADLAGFFVTLRSTTAAMWEREIWAGDTRELRLPGLSIDDVVLGVKAVNREGFESPVMAYTYSLPPSFARPVPMFETYYLALLGNGPRARQLKKKDAERLQEAHMAHIRYMAGTGALAAAGPVASSPDLRGVFVFRTSTIEEARELTAADPKVEAGDLSVRLLTWRGPRGVGEEYRAWRKENPAAQDRLVTAQLGLVRRAGPGAEAVHLEPPGSRVLADGTAEGDGDLLAIWVLDAATEEEAQKIVESVEEVKAGQVRLEMHTWYFAERTFPKP
jgi:uncharacterized protein YciI